MTLPRNITHSLTIASATADGDVLAVCRTRDNGFIIMADHVECSDIDAFIHAPVDGKPGITVEVFSQRRSNEHNIPPHLWNMFFDLICERLQFHAIKRRAMTRRIQRQLPAPDVDMSKKPTLIVTTPKDMENCIAFLDGQSCNKLDEALEVAEEIPTKISLPPVIADLISKLLNANSDEPEEVPNNPDFKDYLKPGQVMNPPTNFNDDNDPCIPF